jgi:predicted ABC-type ATPase
MKNLYIIRGISGSGKSTFVKKTFLPDILVCSADHFFIDGDGQYNFDPSKLGQAHAACFSKFLDGVKHDRDIVVDNTHCEEWEYRNYVKVGLMMGYTVTIYQNEPKSKEKIVEYAKRNTHNVPLQTVMMQFAKFDPVVRFNNVEVVEFH